MTHKLVDNRKFRLLIVCLFIALLSAISISFMPGYEKKAQTKGSHKVISVDRKALKEKYVREQDKIFLSKLNVIHPKASINSEDDVKKKLIKSFKRMHAMGNYFNAKALQAIELQELIEDDNNIDIAVSVLTDFESGERSFGEDQAIARVYALKMLAEATRDGNSQLLYDVSVEISEKLNDVVESGGAIKSGREEDLKDLLHILIQRRDISDFEDQNHLITFLYDTGYKEGMHDQVVRFYDNAIFFPLLNKYGREHATRLVGAALGE